MEPAPEFVVEFSYGNAFKRLDDWSADGETEMGIINALLLVYITHITYYNFTTQLNRELRTQVSDTSNFLSPHHNYILS